MKQKLINFFKFNNHNFEELSFANSNFVMPEKEFFNNFLFASEDSIKQNSSTSESLPEGYTKTDNTSFFDKMKKKIKSFFTPKSKVLTFQVDMNSIVETGGNYKTRPFYSFVSNIGSKMVDITEKIKTSFEKSKTNNKPLVYSESLIPSEAKKTKKEDTQIGLLGEGIKDTNIIIPNKIQEIPNHTPEPSIPTSNTSKSIVYKSSTKGLHYRNHSISAVINRNYGKSMAAINKYKGIVDFQPHDSIDRTALPEIDTHDKSEH